MPRESIEERRARLTPGAHWIRAQRELRGWTGRELARQLGIAQDRVSSYERAHDEPPADFARALAQVFGMSELEVWRGLRKPLPRDLDRGMESADEVMARIAEQHPGRSVVAFVRDEYPGVLEALAEELPALRDALAAHPEDRPVRKSRRGKAVPGDVTRPGEFDVSASSP